MFDELESNNEDEIDIMSEGAMEREIMMDQIRMGEIGEMQQYQKYNLHVENMRDLDMQDSDELQDVSSENSDEAADKDEDEAAH